MTIKRPKKQSKSVPTSEWWDALKVVALRTLAKGQLPFATLCFTFLGSVFLWKTESSDLVKIVQIFAQSSLFSLSGWILALLATVVVWYQNQMYKKDIDRVVLERNEAQAKLIPEMKSSNHSPTLIGKEVKNDAQ